MHPRTLELRRIPVATRGTTPIAGAGLLAVLVAACAPGGERATADGEVAIAPPPAESTWMRMPWAPHDGQDAEDRGTGVVHLTTPSGPASTARTDTLLFRAAPSADAAPVAALLVEHAADGGWAYSVAAPAPVVPRLLEYGYEEAGVPTDSTDASGRWVRGVLGADAGGAPVRGWAELRDGHTARLQWAEHLREQPVFLLRPDRDAFRAAPGGAAVPVGVPVAGHVSDTREHTRGSADAVAIYPVAASGAWLRVRVVSPSDLCVPPDSAPRAETYAWIRYLDERGRPLVWYHTRCNPGARPVV